MLGDSLCRLNIDILGGVTILPIAEVPAKSRERARLDVPLGNS